MSLGSRSGVNCTAHPTVDGAGEGLGEQGLADAGDVLDEQVPLGEQHGDRRADDGLLALDDGVHGGRQRRRHLQDRVEGGSPRRCRRIRIGRGSSVVVQFAHGDPFVVGGVANDQLVLRVPSILPHESPMSSARGSRPPPKVLHFPPPHLNWADVEAVHIQSRDFGAAKSGCGAWWSNVGETGGSGGAVKGRGGGASAGVLGHPHAPTRRQGAALPPGPLPRGPLRGTGHHHGAGELPLRVPHRRVPPHLRADGRGAQLVEERARPRSRVPRASALRHPDRQGRVTIPAPLRAYAGLERECTVIGNGSRLEVWDTARWDAYLDEVMPAYSSYSVETEEVVPGL
jgi:hypothetical protein